MAKVGYLNPDLQLQSYVIGLAIGDGNLTNPNGRAPRLRITCDTKYPNLIKNICLALQKLLPDNKVSTVLRKESYLDVAVYSAHLEQLLGWRVGHGSKFIQKVGIPHWVKHERKYSIECLRGLIQTDGSIYTDRGYIMMMFVTIIPNLAQDVHRMIESLGFKPHSYKILPRKNKYNFNQQVAYHIRLSKNVQEFLNLVRPDKS